MHKMVHRLEFVIKIRKNLSGADLDCFSIDMSNQSDEGDAKQMIEWNHKTRPRLFTIL